MLHLPDFTFLGKLTTQEVFEFYDIPLLFTCTNEANQVYIVVSVEETSTEHKWLYSPISSDAIEKLRKGFVDFKETFKNTVNGFSFVVTNIPEKKSEIQPIFSLEIPDDWLPLQGERIENAGNEKTVPYYAEPKYIADSTQRGILNVMLDVNDEKHEASARYLGRIINDLQDFIDELGLKHSGQKHKNVPKYIKNQTELNVAFSFPSSFGLQLRSVAHYLDPSFTLIEEAILSFVKIVNAKPDSDSLETYLNPSESRIVSRFSKFLGTVDSFGVGFSCQYASPKRVGKVVANNSRRDIVEKLAIVKSIESATVNISTNGILTGLNIRTRRFEIVSSSGSIYSGHILDEAFESALQAKIGSRYSATLAQVKSIGTGPGHMRDKFFLVSLVLDTVSPGNDSMLNS
ncbi:MAG: hypothetical protein FD177_107 [Desulfovibrionaceae bacterium]|nr:MAG: hypothetical protein FD177_107 [Desulfovibrionaceae bacterium]